MCVAEISGLPSGATFQPLGLQRQYKVSEAQGLTFSLRMFHIYFSRSELFAYKANLTRRVKMNTDSQI